MAPVRKGNCGLRVYEGQIKEFGMGTLEHVLPSVNSREELLRQFGSPQYVAEHWSTGELMSTTFVYARGIRLHFDEWDQVLSFVNVDDSLTYGDHAEWGIPRNLFNK